MSRKLGRKNGRKIVYGTCSPELSSRAHRSGSTDLCSVLQWVNSHEICTSKKLLQQVQFSTFYYETCCALKLQGRQIQCCKVFFIKCRLTLAQTRVPRGACVLLCHFMPIIFKSKDSSKNSDKVRSPQLLYDEYICEDLRCYSITMLRYEPAMYTCSDLHIFIVPLHVCINPSESGQYGLAKNPANVVQYLPCKHKNV